MPPTKTVSVSICSVLGSGSVHGCSSEDLGSLISSSEQGRCIYTLCSVCTIQHPYTIHPLTGLSGEKVIEEKEARYAIFQQPVRDFHS